MRVNIGTNAMSLGLIGLALVGCAVEIGTDVGDPVAVDADSVTETTASALAAQAFDSFTVEERCFRDKINAERRARGLRGLTFHYGLASYARNHSMHQATEGRIYHSELGSVPISGWSRLGENVGRGGTCSSLHGAFMASSGHAANLLGDYTHIGVGTVHTDTGFLYTTHVFAKLSAPYRDINPNMSQGGDFDGDGRDDVALFSQVLGIWWVGRGDGGLFEFRRWVDFGRDKGWSSPLVGDFNGDGRDDLALYRTDEGEWRVQGSRGNRFSNSIWATHSRRTGWGATLAGDFDGDGDTDIARYRTDDGRWRVLRSNGSSAFGDAVWATHSNRTGWSNTVVGDFNGDGRDDIARYRSGNGQWRVLRSTGSGFHNTVWWTHSLRTGWSHTRVGDFDGDGRDDIAQYRQATGAWHVLSSQGASFAGSTWATHGARTVWKTSLVGDYDGDGRDDIARYRPDTGEWRVLRSTGARFANTRWVIDNIETGWSATRVGDFNGDGRSDIARYHRGRHLWRVLRSTGDSFVRRSW